MSFFGGLAQGFIQGYKLADSDDRQYKKLRNMLLTQQIRKASDPQRDKLEMDVLRGRAAAYSGLGADRDMRRQLLDLQKRKAALELGEAEKDAPGRAEDRETTRRINKLKAEDYEASVKGTGRYAPPAPLGGADIAPKSPEGEPAPATAPPGPTRDPRGPGGPLDPRVSALPTGGDDSDDTQDLASLEGDDAVGGDDTQSAAKGGRIRPRMAIPAYAGGGAVDNDWREIGYPEKGGKAQEAAKEAPVPEYTIGDHVKAGMRAVFEGEKYRENAARAGWREPGNELYDKRRRIKDYAEGGEVEEDDTPAPAQGSDDDDELLPENAELTEGRGYSLLAAHDAAHAGLTTALAAHTPRAAPRPVAVPTSNPGGYRPGAVAMSPQEVEAVKAKIDPDGKMPLHERNMKALGEIWKYYLGKNDLNSAHAAAAGMVENYQQMAAKYASLSAVAAQKGDMNSAIEAAIRAYAYVPNGGSIKLKYDPGTKRISYEHTAEDGKVTARGLVTPDEMGQKIMGLATPQGFVEALSAAAGARQAKGKGKGDDSGMKMSDRKIADEMTTKADETDAETGKLKGPPELKEIRNQLLTAPQNLKERRGQDQIKRQVDIMSGETPGKFNAEDAEGGKIVTFDGGAKLFVPQEQFGRLMTMFTKKRTEAEAKDKDKDKPGFISGVRDAVRRGAEKTPPLKPPGYGAPLSELHEKGRVSGTPIDTSRPPMSDIDSMNAARRAQGLPPIREDQVPAPE
jgi:hypothetical protein